MGAPGFWPDLDMIPFGRLQTMQPAVYDGIEREVKLSGYGTDRQCQLTPDEMKTFITIRSLAASPLMVGGDLPSMDDFSLSLITDKDMLECNQNGQTGVLVCEKDGIEAWLTKKTDEPGKGWLGIFNRRKETATVEWNARDLQLGTTKNERGDFGENLPPFRMKDIWNRKEFVLAPEGRKFRIQGHGVLFMSWEAIKQNTSG